MSPKQSKRREGGKTDVMKPKLDICALLIDRLKQAIDGLKGAGGKITVRTYEIPSPRRFTGRQVRGIRNTLGLSQALFAKLVGVSKKLVESWEGGTRVPSTMACRLLEAMHREPLKYVRVTRDERANARAAKAPAGKKRVA